ncbi:hypothetical protein ACP88_01415 [Pseudomonas oleovorans]|nr:hypothetical protein [Pseudomonas oleovorans]
MPSCSTSGTTRSPSGAGSCRSRPRPPLSKGTPTSPATVGSRSARPTAASNSRGASHFGA